MLFKRIMFWYTSFPNKNKSNGGGKKTPTWKSIQFHTYPKLTVVKYSSKAHVTGALQPGNFIVGAKPKIKPRNQRSSMPMEVAMLRLIFKLCKPGFVISTCLCPKMLRCSLLTSYYTFSVGHRLVRALCWHGSCLDIAMAGSLCNVYWRRYYCLTNHRACKNHKGKLSAKPEVTL